MAEAEYLKKLRLFKKALRFGRSTVVQELMESGVSPNATINTAHRMFSSMSLAAQCGQIGVLKVLIRGGGDIHGSSQEERTPLGHACSRGHLEVAKLLIQHGANLESGGRKSNARWTCLHFASNHGFYEITELLLKHGADVHQRTSRKKSTALHLACKAGEVEIARILLEYGAEIDVVDHEGRTPLDCAVNCHFGMLQTLLFQAGARPSLAHAKRLAHQNHLYARFGWLKVPPPVPTNPELPDCLWTYICSFVDMKTLLVSTRLVCYCLLHVVHNPSLRRIINFEGGLPKEAQTSQVPPESPPSTEHTRSNRNMMSISQHHHMMHFRYVCHSSTSSRIVTKNPPVFRAEHMAITANFAPLHMNKIRFDGVVLSQPNFPLTLSQLGFMCHIEINRCPAESLRFINWEHFERWRYLRWVKSLTIGVRVLQGEPDDDSFENDVMNVVNLIHALCSSKLSIRMNFDGNDEEVKTRSWEIICTHLPIRLTSLHMEVESFTSLNSAAVTGLAALTKTRIFELTGAGSLEDCRDDWGTTFQNWPNIQFIGIKGCSHLGVTWTPETLRVLPPSIPELAVCIRHKCVEDVLTHIRTNMDTNALIRMNIHIDCYRAASERWTESVLSLLTQCPQLEGILLRGLVLERNSIIHLLDSCKNLIFMRFHSRLFGSEDDIENEWRIFFQENGFDIFTLHKGAITVGKTMDGRLQDKSRYIFPSRLKLLI